MEKYSATKKRHTETNDSDEEVPAPAMKRKSKHNNVSDILADSVQIKRKDSELRQQELELRTEEQRQQRLFQEHLLAQQQQAQQQQHTMNLAMLNAIGELLQKIKNSWTWCQFSCYNEQGDNQLKTCFTMQVIYTCLFRLIRLKFKYKTEELLF